MIKQTLACPCTGLYKQNKKNETLGVSLFNEAWGIQAMHIDDILPQDMRYGCRTCNWLLLQPG
jgi:hypothetical protein